MTDYLDLKVPVFNGINDIPTAPTASKAGNGSHLIATINSLIDRLAQQPTASNSNWNVISTEDRIETSIYLEANTKNLLTLGSQEYAVMRIAFPENPTIGTYVTLLKVDESLSCNLETYGQIRNHATENTYLNAVNEEITFIYMGVNEGWTFNRNNLLTFMPVQS